MPKIRRLVTHDGSHLLHQIQTLNQEFSGNPNKVDAMQLHAALNSPHNAIFAAFDGGKLVGLIMVSVIPLITRTWAVIENVIVKETHRRRKIGTHLVEEALKQAKKLHATNCDIVCNNARPEAKLFYEKMGFSLRDATAYRKQLS